MMTELETTSDIGALLQAGNDALRAGDPFAARKYFRRATELEPDNVFAWLGMAHAVRPYKEKYTHLQRARALDPSSEEVQAQLAFVEEQLAAGAVLAPQVKPQPPAHDEPGPAPHDDDGDEYDHDDSEHGHNGHDHDAQEVETMVCYRHPDRETGLLCVQCGRPICTECVRPAFVGQLCPECAKDRRPVNYQVTPRTLSTAGPIAVLFSVVFNTLAVYVFAIIGLGFFLPLLIAFFIGPMIAELTLRLIDRVTGNKRGKEMQATVGISYGLGAVAVAMILGVFTFLPWLVFVGMSIATLIGRLR
jgi:hypothetical protein